MVPQGNLTDGKGENLLAAETKKLLADTLTAMLEKRPLDKITVKELVESCHVNRQTFYYNFQDIYALVGWIFTEKANKILSGASPDERWQDILKDVLLHCAEDKTLILHTFRAMDHRMLERFIRHWMDPIMEKIVDEEAVGMNLQQVDRNFIIDMYTLGFIGLAMKWMENNMTDEYLKEFDRFVKLIDGSLSYTIGKFCE